MSMKRRSNDKQSSICCLDYRFLRTIFSCTVGILYGLLMGMLGPSIPDLCTRLSISVEHFSWALSANYLFLMVLPFLFGAGLHRWPAWHGAVLSGTLVGVGTCALIKVRVTSLWYFATCSIIEALLFTILDLVNDTSMLRLWTEKADSAIQSWHFTWSIGFAFGPLLVRPYLSPDIEDTTRGNVTLESWMNSSDLMEGEVGVLGLGNSTTAPRFADDSRIEIPFSIVAGVFYTLAALNLLFIFCRPASNYTSVPISETTVPISETTVPITKTTTAPSHFTTSSSSSSSSSVDKSGCALVCADKCFRGQMWVLFVLFYFCVGGVEIMFHTWVFTFAMSSDLGFSKYEAALLDSITKFVMAGSRLLSTIITGLLASCGAKYTSQMMLFTSLFGVMATIIPLALVGSQSKLNLWICTCCYQLFTAPLWGAGKGWMDKYLPVTPAMLGLVYIGVGGSGMLYQWISGYILTYMEPSMLMYVLLTSDTLLMVVMILGQVRAACHGSRYARSLR